MRTKLKAGLILCLIVAAFAQNRLDPTIAEINKGQKTAWTGMSTEFILGPLLGLQQAVAGLLWVRADEFFHEGDYDAILPIVRMVTWLDPHNLDVYITGGWHLAYNFTDQNERSDRRYLPAAQKLLEEGDFNNPEVYDIAFELAWQNTDKVKDYEKAEFWLRQAVQRHAADAYGVANQPVPMFVYHQLAHTLERRGRIRECIDVWKQVLAMSEQRLKANPKDFSLLAVRDSERHNLTLTLKRLYSREVHGIDFKLDAVRTKSVNMDTGEPSPPDAYIETSGPNAGKPRPPAVVPPYETAFDVRPYFPEPKVLDLTGRGQFNVADGARVTILLHDVDVRQFQPTLAVRDVRDFPRLIADLKAPGDPLSAYLRSRFSPTTLALLNAYSGGNPSEELKAALVLDLNHVIVGPLIYDPQRFAKVNISPDTREWMARKPFGGYLYRVNRELLEEAFSGELVRGLREFSFNLDQSETRMWDQHSVRNALWGRKIDMSKDPKMYSFSGEYYYLVFEFNPRGTSPFIQDRFGWSGEGMTDRKYLWIDRTTDPPVRMIRKVYRISRAQVMGAEPITENDVVPNEVYDHALRQL